MTDISALLAEPHSLGQRKAYKAVSMYCYLEQDAERLRSQQLKICRHALSGGITDRFTYRYALRIVCQFFEKLSNVDELNKMIHYSLSKETKIIKTTMGLLTLLNFFTYKYGPEKIDTILFTEIVCGFCGHQNPKIRNEAYKFFVLVAYWKENTESVKQIVHSKLKITQRNTLYKMFDVFTKMNAKAEIEGDSEGLVKKTDPKKSVKSEIFESKNYDDMLEDSDDDTWYSKDGTKLSRKEFLEALGNDEIEPIKFGPVFLRQTISNYR